MIWDKPITADGCTATPEQMQKAWDEWVFTGRRGKAALAYLLTKAGAVGTCKFWPTGRVADRMLQKARKAGAVRFVKGRWEIIPEPRP